MNELMSKTILSNRLLLGAYLFYSFFVYLSKTLFSPYALIYLRRFNEYWQGLLKNQLAFQNDPTEKALILQSNLIDNDPSKIQGYLDLIAANPECPKAYFAAANGLYLQGKYLEAMHHFYAQGLEILEKQAAYLGLNYFSSRIVSEEWAIIGHLSLLDCLIKLRKLDLLSPEKRVVYMRKSVVANPCYLSYLSDHIDVVYLNDIEYLSLRDFSKSIFEHLSCLKLSQGFTNLYSAWNLAERSWEEKQLPPLLKLKDHDKERGWKTLAKLSIPNDAFFVALHVREGDKRSTRSNSNAKLKSYLKAIQAITDRGGWVIRMGHPGMTPLPQMEKVVDYANSQFKSDWMDVFLWASCRFFIGTSSGPLTVPPTFGRPILYTNSPAIGINSYFPKSLMLPKLYYSNTEKRLFSFEKMMNSSLGWTVSSVFDGIDCTIVDNSPEEIELAVIEMLTKCEVPEAFNQLSDLQVAFNNLRIKYGDTGQMTISQTFSQKYSSLLNEELNLIT